MSEKTKEEMVREIINRRNQKYDHTHLEQVNDLIIEGKTYREISKITGIGLGTISRMVNNQDKYKKTTR